MDHFLRIPNAGFAVSCHGGPPPRPSPGALEIDVGSALPVAFAGIRRILRALEERVPEVLQTLRATCGAEWNVLFPGSPVRALDLYAIADAPNQRRLFRESEQTYRILSFAARALVAAVAALRRPVVLRNVGACDLVSVRGLMHAVELSRLHGVGESLSLCDLERSSCAPGGVALLRREQLAEALRRMRATGDTSLGSARGEQVTALEDPSLEGRYLAHALDPSAAPEDRVAASLLALRACFFSTNHEGAVLAAENGLRLFERGLLVPSAILAAWDRLDDATFDIPMIELDREALGDGSEIRAQLELNLGVAWMFTGKVEDGLAAFDRALALPISPELASDLHMYRALTLAKRLGRIEDGRAEIEAGLAVLRGTTPERARVHEAWLRNLYALTYVFEKDLAGADHQEQLALAAIDDVPGPSAAHLKTNIVSNVSVLFEAKGNLPMALAIWSSFEGLNRKLQSTSADKVQNHRLAALQNASGQTDEAIRSYETAFRCAELTHDLFHGEVIAAAIARIHLSRGALAEAEQWYGAAAERALACGDCVARAKDLAGLELARGGTDFADAAAALACNSTYALERSGLAEAFRSGTRAAVLSVLPPARSKMSRPFDLVNL